MNVCHQAAKEVGSDAKACTDDLVPLAQALTTLNAKIAYHNEWIKGITNRLEV